MPAPWVNVNSPAGAANASAAAATCNDPHMTSIVAQLSVRRGTTALEFYAAAFGAAVDYRVGEEEIVAQLSIGDATFWISDEAPDVGNVSPETVGGCTTRMLLIVDDPDAVVARAVDAGATLVY